MKTELLIKILLISLEIAAFVLVYVYVMMRTMLETRGMSTEDLTAIYCFDYGEASSESDVTPVDCAVCLESFKAGEKCRLLPHCSHSFHAQCIDSWLLKRSTCPVCRACAKPKRKENQLA